MDNDYVVQLYRETTIGEAVIGSINEMVDEQQLSPEIAEKLILAFDEIVDKNFSRLWSNLRINRNDNQLVAYHNQYGMWRFWCKDLTIRLTNSQTLKVDKLYIKADGDPKKAKKNRKTKIHKKKVKNKVDDDDFDDFL